MLRPARMLQSPGSFFFRSRFSDWLYAISISHSWRAVRLAGMVVIATVLTARCIRLYLRYRFCVCKPP